MIAVTYLDTKDSLDADRNIRLEVSNHDIVLLRIPVAQGSCELEHRLMENSTFFNKRIHCTSFVLRVLSLVASTVVVDRFLRSVDLWI